MKNRDILDTHSDQKYIDALLINDTVLLDELYKKFSGKIKWMVLQNNGTETDAADIFQDAILSIYDKAKNRNFRLTCPLDAILYLICKNKWINELNKKKSRKVTFQDTDGYNNIGEDIFKISEDCLLQQARKNLLEEKLTQLGDSCRQMLQLSWSGKTMDQVATLLGVTYGYARKKKSECMAKLVALIKDSSKFTSLKW